MISNNSDKFVSAAIDMANKSKMVFRHGSVLVRNGKIISTGYNHSRNYIQGKGKFCLIPYFILSRPCCSIHSEISCLLSYFSFRIFR